MYAIAYALQDKFGVVPTENEIETYSTQAKVAKGRQDRVLKLPEIIWYMKKESFCGYKVEDYKEIYNPKIPKYKEFKENDIAFSFMNGWSLIFGLNIREGGLKANNLYIYKPDYKKKIIDGHALFCDGCGSYGYSFVNSHGKYFGQEGHFSIDMKDAKKEVNQIMGIKFQPKYS